MRKSIIGFLLIVMVIVCLAGCVGDTPADVPPGSSSQSAAPAPDKKGNGNEEDMIALLLTSGTVTGNDTEVEYAWSVSRDRLNITYYGVHYDLARVPGSDRYWCLHREGGYTWLVDVLTGKLLDPLAGLEQNILNDLSEVKFSPDGKYALICYKSGTVLELLEVATGTRTKMPYEDGLYSVSGDFLDNGTALLISSHQDADGQISYSLSRYDIAAGGSTEIPGRYVSEDRNAENFMAMIAGPYAYTFPEGKLAIVDLRTLEKTVYPLGISQVTAVSYHTADSILVAAGDAKYLLKTDGSMQTVSE